MPAGIEAYDEQGRLIVALTTRLSRITGYVNTQAGVAGSVQTNPQYGEPWYLFLNSGRFPIVTRNIQTGVISWDSTGLDNMTMMYGVR